MKAVAFLAVGIAVLAALFYAFKPAADVRVPAAPLPATATTSPPTALAPVPSATAPVPAQGTTPANLAFEIEVARGKLAKGPEVIKVREGDELTLRITADVADELHLHGYDRHAHLKPGVTAILKLKATKTGRFTYELHKSGLELGALEVHPR